MTEEKGEEKQGLTGTAEVLPEILISEDEDTNQVIFRRIRNQSGDFQKDEDAN